MRFTFPVGDIDKHLIEFNFNQLCGTLVIRMDNQPVFRATRFFNEPVQNVYQFVIAGLEKSEVRIEQRRKPLFGHHSRVFVNNRLINVFDSLF
jgi:hypothetical protein